ncbi:hypothetical protein BGZ61DRAFT_481363 [Ilyonectria robusta]|uniref:uncharacterized protein n=1 Tax=Ilyonectria robusta TaxID=1079257 RepID=UPI001E8DA872|nr:uncharacterized protein BGZ61DRAFT_481363 [Ilyonectria robusta]KAH8679312.1 hypothetical protein BGZ61DRAFT_481363 [Ilyonectria robusta]
MYLDKLSKSLDIPEALDVNIRSRMASGCGVMEVACGLSRRRWYALACVLARYETRGVKSASAGDSVTGPLEISRRQSGPGRVIALGRIDGFIHPATVFGRLWGRVRYAVGGNVDRVDVIGGFVPEMNGRGLCSFECNEGD